MIRLHMIVEGQTEESFCNGVLKQHFSALNVFPRIQLTNPRKSSVSRVGKGGWNSYGHVKRHILRWAKSDDSPDVWLTTMLDLYAIPTDFPGFQTSLKKADPHERVEFLEGCFRDDLAEAGVKRFVPYLQLHEFEALLFSSPDCFDAAFLEHDKQIKRLKIVAGKFETPEHIDSHPESAPSKQIINEIPEYAGRKVSAGPLIAGKIGLRVLREKCLHFHKWVANIEGLNVDS